VVLTRHAVEHLLHTSGRGRRGGAPPKRRSRRRALRRWPEAREETPPAAVQQAIDGVVALLSGAAVDLSTVPLDMERVPTFDRRVYEIARAIPPGHTLTLATSRPGSAIPARHAKSARRWGEIRSPSSCRATASSPPAARPADFPPPAASPPSSACSKSSAPDGQRADPVRPGRGVRAAATPRVADGPLRRR
jgi:hypothetical protein